MYPSPNPPPPPLHNPPHNQYPNQYQDQYQLQPPYPSQELYPPSPNAESRISLHDPVHEPLLNQSYAQPQGDYNAPPNSHSPYSQSYYTGFSGAEPMPEQQRPADTPIEMDDVRVRYGSAPRHQPRRNRTTKKVQLVSGNLVLDCPVPERYLQNVPLRDEKEFTQMRYTAATCDPNDFKDQNYTLRQALMGRTTELFIVMTMYNEDEVLFCRTMHGVMKNIAHLCTRERSRTWGKDGWKKVVVCIVSDGRKKVNERTLHVLSAMGIYQDGVAKNVVNNKPVTAHIYEFTTQLSMDPDLQLRGNDKGIIPVQVLFCLKEKNQKKINSHRWFFNAFGKVLQPNVCVLLDVGTRPGPTSIYKLWKTFDLNSNVGGACGEIRAMTGTGGVNLLNPLVAAQNFEYKMSNILDKPLESVFGYISVLPGAFSAYRYIALQNDEHGRGPLESYFKGETLHGGDADVFTANMYLAEDRILCFELVAKRDDAWVLRYVKSAYGETDVPDAVPEFISQRRRWLNGSFFAAVYALYHVRDIGRSAHSLTRKVMLYIEFVYQAFSLLFAWFFMANFFITFFILADSLTVVNPPPFSKNVGDGLKAALSFVYVTLLVVQFVMALGNRPQGSKWSYTAIMIFFAIIMAYMLFASIYITVIGIQTAIQGANGGGFLALLRNNAFRDIVISLAATYIMYFVSSLLYLDPWHMFTSFVQYIFMMPSYINVLNIYAFCNTHDISWGTKGDTGVSTELGVVQSKKEDGMQTVEVAVPTEQKDLNADYDLAITELKRKVEAPKQQRDAKTKQEDYYRTFRTRLVVVWLLTNALLAVLVTLVASRDGLIAYFAFILWSVVALSFIRFLGSVVYLILQLIQG
ncbi:uncharacterized protein VTP21DRAFT_4513 [Calcarisporiella thermophila]|uniref:uncharacterized protein n=1 Tax=Calcarisporiella thermophila TaxID=911321 RepID=UPI0037423CB4